MLKVQYRTELNKNMNIFHHILFLAFCFCVTQFTFIKGGYMFLTHNPWFCKSFPLNTDFCYVQAPFKTGVAAIRKKRCYASNATFLKPGLLTTSEMNVTGGPLKITYSQSVSSDHLPVHVDERTSSFQNTALLLCWQYKVKTKNKIVSEYNTVLLKSYKTERLVTLNKKMVRWIYGYETHKRTLRHKWLAWHFFGY